LVCVGPINEHAGGSNAEWNPHRARLVGLMQRLLPQHLVSTGPCGWNHLGALDGYQLLPGAVVHDLHAYCTWDWADTAAWLGA